MWKIFRVHPGKVWMLKFILQYVVLLYNHIVLINTYQLTVFISENKWVFDVHQLWLNKAFLNFHEIDFSESLDLYWRLFFQYNYHQNDIENYKDQNSRYISYAWEQRSSRNYSITYWAIIRWNVLVLIFEQVLILRLKCSVIFLKLIFINDFVLYNKAVIK